MQANRSAAPELPPTSAKGEVAGSFLIGLTQAFYNLSVLPQGMALKVDTIDAAQWYPYSMLIDTFSAIEKNFPSSRHLSIRAGMNFIRVWYEHGPGKTMIHSTLDWLHANDDDGAGYNSVVRGGSKREIGWCRMLSIDETEGIAVYENVMPLTVDFVSGVFYGGCFIFDDMEYVAVEGTSEAYAPNPSFNRLVHTVRFRPKPKDTCADLDRRIDDLQLGGALILTPAEVDSLIWRYKGLRHRHAVATEYYNEIKTILADAIAESRRIAKELELAKAAADAANLAKSAFLASVSHELRTPLNAILGFSELLRGEADIVGRDREHLDIINRSGAHLLGLINDILDISKIEAGHVQLQVTPLDFHALVQDVVRMMRQRALEKDLELRLEKSPRVVRHIKGDETRLRQVLVNLLGNAIKFTERGSVTLRLEAQPEANEPRLLVEVEDTGPGIAPEDQARVFEPFVQAGLTAGQKGTGLGLAITRQFIELMGGRIGVSSQLGQGSRFWIELPVDLADEADAARAREARSEVLCLEPGQPTWRILIVEDQPENALLLRRLLEDAGFQVGIAANGVEGIERFQQWRPHFIWMDWRMPVMDVLEATRRIRALEGGAAVKIVALTASAFAEQRGELLAAGMDDILHKPYRSAEIFAYLERILGVRYVYRECRSRHWRSAVPLNSTVQTTLPEVLRSEMLDALVTLDTARIDDLIEQIAEWNVELSHYFRSCADEFDYGSIEAVLRNERQEPTLLKTVEK